MSKDADSIRAYPVNTKVTKLVNNAQISHELHNDATGFHHRVRWDDSVGEWAGYEFIAILSTNGRRFCGTTEYYDGCFPELFEVLV